MLFLIKKVFQCILYFREDLRLVFNYFPLKIVNIKSPYTFEHHSFESYDDRLQTDEPQETKTDSTPSVHIPIPFKILD